jgi:DNA polymerase III subunit delta'
LDLVKEQAEGVSYLKKVVDGTYRSPLLLIGDSGIGKRFSVLQAIKQSASKGNPDAVYQIDNKIHPDVSVIESEGGKDIGIEAVRGVLSKAVTHPMVAPYKYLVVDGADRLTNPAANAILKTLEEPPDKTRFFLIAESLTKVIPTIRSRCGRVRYKRLSEKFIAESLKDFVSDPDKLLVYSRLAEGSLGRAFNYFASSRLGLRDRSFGLIKAGISGDVSSIFSAVGNIGKDDMSLALHFLELLLYDLTMIAYAPNKILNLDLASELGSIRKTLGEGRIRNLQKGLSELLLRDANTQITLDFHVKTFLANAFIG